MHQTTKAEWKDDTRPHQNVIKKKVAEGHFRRMTREAPDSKSRMEG